MKKIYRILCLAMLIVAAGCGSSSTVDFRDPASVFKAGKEALDDRDWIEAERLFDVVRLQFPASAYADDALYHLGELHFQKEAYIMANFNYNMVRRSYPNSEYTKISLYKSALCYYQLSPPFDRDQEYTKKGIQAFMEFQSFYPTDSLTAAADAKIDEMRNKLAKKEFETALLYKKLYSNKSALVYYDVVIDEYQDSQYYESAYIGKAETLTALKRYDEAQELCQKYFIRFPSGSYYQDMKSLCEALQGK